MLQTNMVRPPGQGPVVLDIDDPNYDPAVANAFYSAAVDEVIPFAVGQVTDPATGVTQATTVITKAMIQDASITTLRVDGEAITAGVATEPTFEQKQILNAQNQLVPVPDFWRVTGAIPYEEHLGGRVQIQASINLSIYQAGGNDKPGCQVEIFFLDGMGSGGSIEVVAAYVQSETIRLEMPVGFEHTSRGGATGLILWECSIRPVAAGGYLYYQVTRPVTCNITRTIMKR